MKRWVTALCALVCSVLAAGAAEEDLRTRFEWRQPLPGGLEQGKLYRLVVPPEVYDGSRMFPSDLRIINENGVQWPFYVWTPAGSTESQYLQVDMLNASTAERYLRQDVFIKPDPRTGARRQHSQVIVKTPGRDFIRRVEVYGSEDSREWALLAMGYLVDHSRDVHISNNSIRYPVSTYPYLQVRVYPNARDATETVTLQGVFVMTTQEQPGESQEIELKSVEVTGDDLKEGCQVLAFDVGAKNRPVEKLAVRARDREYARCIRVYGRNEDTNTWRWVADGEIHRIGKDIQDEVALRGSSYRFLKIELYNYDDAPLGKVEVKAQAVPRYLVFEVQGGAGPQLYYGSIAALSPRFDLARRKGDEEAAKAILVRPGERVSNQLHKESRWGKWGPWLAGLAVGIVSLIVIWSVVGMLKRQSSDDEAE